MLTAPFNATLKAQFETAQRFRTRGMGYFIIQATKPQTLGYGLADSPLAVLGWIYEKLHKGVDNYPWTEDEGTRAPTLTCPPPYR